MHIKRDSLTEAELLWLFNFADSDMGLKSSWCSIVQAAQSSGSPYADPHSSHQLRAVSKRREIEKALFQLSSSHQNCLYSLFGPTHLPHPVVAVMLDLAGPSLCLGAEIIRACERQLLGKATEKDRLKISDIRIRAERLKQDALIAYSQKRNSEKKTP